MEKELGYSIEALARRFSRSPTWIARRLALVETLPEAVQQQVREGKIAPQIAMRYLAPVARVSAEQCLRMAQVFAQQHWTTRQAAAFYNAWRGANGLARERILAQPGLFLKAQQQPTPPTLEIELNKIIAIAQRALQLELSPANSQTIRLKIHQATALLNQSRSKQRTMMSQAQRTTILELHAQGTNKREIARLLNLSRQSVRKVLQSN